MFNPFKTPIMDKKQTKVFNTQVEDAVAAATQVENEVVADATLVENDAEDEVEEQEAPKLGFFAALQSKLQQENKTPVLSYGDIVKKCLLSADFQKQSPRKVTRVFVTSQQGHFTVNIRLDGGIIGEVVDSAVDALGSMVVTRSLGYTDSVGLSNITIGNYFANHPRLSIFASSVLNVEQERVVESNGANHSVLLTEKERVDILQKRLEILLLGSTITLLAQAVPAGVEFVSPFDKRNKAYVYQEDRIFHYPIAIELSEAALEKYHITISKS